MIKLIAPKGRVIIKVDLESKSFHTFSNGTKIKLERQYDNFNMRYVKPVNAIVVNGIGVTEGADILIHHNATHDTYRIFNYQPPTKEASSDVKYYSIPEQECFLWKEKGSSTWNTLHNYVTALRIFKPYLGVMAGIEPQQIKNKLYITSGELKGKVCDTVGSADYQIIYQGEDGKEESVIRLRHYENEDNSREEIIAIEHGLTKLVEKGEYLVGMTKNDAKKLND
jgi:hypothetical protein